MADLEGGSIARALEGNSLAILRADVESDRIRRKIAELDQLLRKIEMERFLALRGRRCFLAEVGLVEEDEVIRLVERLNSATDRLNVAINRHRFGATKP